MSAKQEVTSVLIYQTNLTGQRPWALPACTPVAHAITTDRPALVPPIFEAAPRVAGDHGTSGSVGSKIAGKGIANAARQLAGDVRGVPPRGKPV